GGSDLRGLPTSRPACGSDSPGLPHLAACMRLGFVRHPTVRSGLSGVLTHPPPTATTTSRVSPSASSVAAWALRGTISPLRSTAMRLPWKPSCSIRPETVRPGSMRRVSPFKVIFKDSSRFKFRTGRISIAKAVCGGEQVCQYARLVEGMASIVHEVEGGFGPCLVQFPCGTRRCADVVTALHDDAWNVFEDTCIAQELSFFQETTVHEVVVFNSGEGQGGRVVRMRQLMLSVGQ